MLIIPSLEPGGAERVMSAMANHWAKRGLLVELVTWDDGTDSPFFEIDSRVRRTALAVAQPARNFLDGLGNNIRRILATRRALRHSGADAVISFLNQTNIVTLLAARGLGIPVIVSERNDPVNYPLAPTWRRLRDLTYKRADALVVQSEVAAEFYRNHLRIRPRVIPNPVIISDGGESVSAGRRPRVVGMGRLKPAKNFSLLVRAFAGAAKSYPEWQLAIIGDGPEREALSRLAESLGLGSRIAFTGFVSRPHDILRQSDLFVLSSDVEGFPCVLVEAMTCGLPVITTRFHDGVDDIVTHRETGIVVEKNDEGALTAAIAELMGDADTRMAIGSRAMASAARFDLDSTMKRWDALIAEVAV